MAVPLTDLDGLANGLADALLACDADREKLRRENEKSLAILMEYFHSDRYDREIAAAYETVCHNELMQGVK